MGAPSPPDPYATAAAQGKENRETAIASQQLNMVDQSTPYGSLSYKQIGTYSDGTPRFSATTSLTPQLQQTLDNVLGYGTQASQTALNQLGRVQNTLSTPVDLNGAAEGKINALGQARLDPVWNARQTQLDADLVNRGIRPGTAAYSTAMDDFNRQRTDAYNQLALTGRQQSVAEVLAERNQPLQELQALLGQSQVQNPNFVSTPQTKVNAADIQGAVQNSYNAQMQSYNAMMGGLASLGGTFGAMALRSDRRVKRDIRRVGRHRTGVGLYSFRYKTGGPLVVGVMAQEVERVMPRAVSTGRDGVKRVDYAMLEAA